MAKNDIAKTIEISKALKFNGGGHFNHEFFWDSLCAPKDSHRPDHDTQLMRYILKTWDSFEQFEERFEKRTTAIQGSGWGWLASGRLAQPSLDSPARAGELQRELARAGWLR